jgi:fermentation-respiration switch protein FrsA (DUF1100 family)
MKRWMIVAMALCLCVAAVGCGAKPLSEQDILDLVADAKALVAKLEQADYDGVFERFDKNMQGLLPKATLKAQWEAVHAQYGAHAGYIAHAAQSADGYLRIALTAQFDFSAMEITVVFDRANDVAGLFIAQAYNVDDGQPLPAGVVEQEVVVKAGDYALPGKLTLPQEGANLPAVVIVHGSGPSDKDGSLMNLKPYRDIAWALGQKGIAVLRYDKRTLIYQAEMAADQGVSVDAETVEDAVAAVALLRADARIDQSRVYVLGHSLGGMLLPRIQMRAQADGLIFLAASARSLVDQYERQMAYLAQFAVEEGTMTPEQADAAMAQVREQVGNIRGLSADSQLGPASLLGVPKSYWLDLAGYDPVAQAAGIDAPMLFLQGGRDYQVTMDDFALWQALSNKANAEFQSFGALGHMFTPGGAKPSPNDYRTAYVRVDAAVTDAIAAFIKGR